jgi:FHA domain
VVLSATGAHVTLAPSLVVDAAVSRGEREFLLLYGDASILLIEIPAEAAELQQGLDALEAPVGTLPFKTEVQAVPEPPAISPRTARPEDPVRLAKALHGRLHFAVALRKRAGSDTVSPDRISVGRARNKDLVLRHATISKFHAWFETSEDGSLYLNDAESKNQTFVNGEVVVPRRKIAVAPGDSIRFGAVDCLLCTPSTFWAYLRAPLPRVVAQGSIRPPATARPPARSR